MNEVDINGDCETTYHAIRYDTEIMVVRKKQLKKCETQRKTFEDTFVYEPMKKMSIFGYGAENFFQDFPTLNNNNMDCIQTIENNIYKSVNCGQDFILHFPWLKSRTATTVEIKLDLATVETTMPPVEFTSKLTMKVFLLGAEFRAANEIFSCPP